MAKIYSGFSPSRIGDLSFTVIDTITPLTKTFIIGDGYYQIGAGSPVAFDTSFAHVDLYSLFGVTVGTQQYKAFASLLETMIQTGMSDVSWAVSYNEAVEQYSFESPGTISTWDLGYNALFGSAVGLSGALASTTGYTIESDIMPRYVIDTAEDGVSNVSNQYEYGQISYDGETDDGFHYGIGRTAAPKYFDFDVMFEDPGAVFNHRSNVVWTYEQLFQHARNIEPLYIRFDTGAIENTADNYLGFLRADWTRHAPQRAIAEYDAYWNIPFRTRVYASPLPPGV